MGLRFNGKGGGQSAHHHSKYLKACAVSLLFMDPFVCKTGWSVVFPHTPDCPTQIVVILPM